MDLDIQLPYLKRDDLYRHQKPYTTDFAIDHIPDSVASNHRFDYQNVHVVDAQDSPGKFDLERHGFCFVKAETAISIESANDTEYVRDIYFPQVEKALHMALPGYERIDYLDHLVRIRDEAFPDKVGEPTTYAQPACLPHSDFSKHGGFLAMKEFFPGQEPFFENRDFDLINVWRVLRGPNNDWPLAVCDYQSVDLEVDTIKCDVLHESCVGENVVLFRNQKHKWFYLSSQGVDDIIVFRNTSSKEQRSVCFHAAFDTGLEATDPRHSIELRVVAFRPGGEPYEQK
ncbi:uncharacterized protein FMAN_02260 [Fusarium mangiferae]|uniref:7alpha-cephem-methoxylase P8 chain n=1 Tax=Fusarium mangiferae TaxID=192010 RepID=A0A1L7TL60_FUSMA|nr:uncharacterized protein FMAN_02260 [Fusarium mangiferae]CVK99418.1 uncharacterized protein FMAN_02260 [Fusarium mangiferae]